MHLLQLLGRGFSACDKQHEAVHWVMLQERLVAAESQMLAGLHKVRATSGELQSLSSRVGKTESKAQSEQAGHLHASKRLHGCYTV